MKINKILKLLIASCFVPALVFSNTINNEEINVNPKNKVINTNANSPYQRNVLTDQLLIKIETGSFGEDLSQQLKIMNKMPQALVTKILAFELSGNEYFALGFANGTVVIAKNNNEKAENIEVITPKEGIQDHSVSALAYANNNLYIGHEIQIVSKGEDLTLQSIFFADPSTLFTFESTKVGGALDVIELKKVNDHLVSGIKELKKELGVGVEALIPSYNEGDEDLTMTVVYTEAKVPQVSMSGGIKYYKKTIPYPSFSTTDWNFDFDEPGQFKVAKFNTSEQNQADSYIVLNIPDIDNVSELLLSNSVFYMGYNDGSVRSLVPKDANGSVTDTKIIAKESGKKVTSIARNVDINLLLVAYENGTIRSYPLNQDGLVLDGSAGGELDISGSTEIKLNVNNMLSTGLSLYFTTNGANSGTIHYAVIDPRKEGHDDMHETYLHEYTDTKMNQLSISPKSTKLVFSLTNGEVIGVTLNSVGEPVGGLESIINLDDKTTQSIIFINDDLVKFTEKSIIKKFEVGEIVNPVYGVGNLGPEYIVHANRYGATYIYAFNSEPVKKSSNAYCHVVTEKFKAVQVSGGRGTAWLSEHDYTVVNDKFDVKRYCPTL